MIVINLDNFEDSICNICADTFENPIYLQCTKNVHHIMCLKCLELCKKPNKVVNSIQYYYCVFCDTPRPTIPAIITITMPCGTKNIRPTLFDKEKHVLQCLTCLHKEKVRYQKESNQIKRAYKLLCAQYNKLLNYILYCMASDLNFEDVTSTSDNTSNVAAVGAIPN